MLLKNGLDLAECGCGFLRKTVDPTHLFWFGFFCSFELVLGVFNVHYRSFGSSAKIMNPLLVFGMVQTMIMKCYLEECSLSVTALIPNAFSIFEKAFPLTVTSINLSQTQNHQPSFPQLGSHQLHNLQSSYLLIPTPPLLLAFSHSLQW